VLNHASIPADNPERVARAIAQIWKSDHYPFVYPNSYIVIADDGRGTQIEVTQRGNEQVPAALEVGLRVNPVPSPYSEVHLNIVTSLSEQEVLSIGEREAWIARICDREFFKLIELWLENRFLLEVITENEARRYVQFTQSRNWRGVLEKEPMPLAQFGYTDQWLSGPEH
jgi:hypothetical protein